MRGGTLLGGGASALRRKHCELPAEVRRPAVAHSGLLLGTRRRLDNKGRRCGHQPAAPRGRATGGQRFQQRLGSARGAGAGRGY